MTATPTDSLPLTRWLNGPGGVVAPLIGDSRVSDASAGSAPLIDPATEEPIAEQSSRRSSRSITRSRSPPKPSVNGGRSLPRGAASCCGG